MKGETIASYRNDANKKFYQVAGPGYYLIFESWDEVEELKTCIMRIGAATHRGDITLVSDIWTLTKLREALKQMTEQATEAG